MVKDYDAKPFNLGYFLSDQTKITLQIPDYQRGYSWKNEQVSEFFSDLCEHMNESGEYYFGTVTTIDRSNPKQDIKKYELIDGQQRFVTAIILMVCIRDKLHELKSESVKHIERQIFNRDAERGQKERYKITLAKTDNGFFRDVILERLPKRDKKFDDTDVDYATKLNLKNAYCTIQESINNIIKGKPRTKKIDFLDGLADTLRTHFVISNLIVSKPSKAFILFNRMNDRGLKLAISDLTKNLILSSIREEKNSDEAVSHAAEKWEEIETKLLKKKTDIDNFIHHYLVTFHSSVTVNKQKTFRYIRKNKSFDTLEDILKPTKKSNGLEGMTGTKLLDSMLEKFNDYYKLISCKWNSNTANAKMTRTARCNVGWINELEIIIVYPVLMAWLEKYGEKNFEKLTDIILKWFFRVKTVANGNASELEKELAHIAYKIINGDHTLKKFDIGSVRNRLTELDISQDLFYDYLIELSLGSKAARYFLTQIIEDMEPVRKSDLRPNTLEHIMPNGGIRKPFGNNKSPSNWLEYIQEVNGIKDKKDAEAFHRKYKNRLGNLTMIHYSKNSGLGAKPFDEKCGKCGEERKCGKYGDSKITITKNITKKKKWNKIAIESRQRYLAKHAKRIWKI